MLAPARLPLVRPNQPQTLTGIETLSALASTAALRRPNQPQTLTGIETNTPAMAGVFYCEAQSTSNPYRD